MPISIEAFAWIVIVEEICGESIEVEFIVPRFTRFLQLVIKEHKYYDDLFLYGRTSIYYSWIKLHAQHRFTYTNCCWRKLYGKEFFIIFSLIS